MANPTCPSGCDEATPVPAFSFDFCAPETHGGEIAKIWLTKKGNPIVGADASSMATSITTRMSAVDDTKIEVLTVIGEKAEPTTQTRTLSGGRQVVTTRDHSVSFTIDEINLVNYEAMRKIQCGAGFLAWYLTSDEEWLFGGKDGIECSMVISEVIPLGRADLMTLRGTLTWSDKFSPEAIDNPTSA